LPSLLLVPCSARGHDDALLPEGLQHGRQCRDPPDTDKKAKAKVEDDGSFVIDGEFTVWRNQETGRLAVRVDLRLKNSQGSVQLLFSRAIFPTDDQDTSIEDLLGSK
jgi:hypothetical protein